MRRPLTLDQALARAAAKAERDELAHLPEPANDRERALLEAVVAALRPHDLVACHGFAFEDTRRGRALFIGPRPSLRAREYCAIESHLASARVRLDAANIRHRANGRSIVVEVP